MTKKFNNKLCGLLLLLVCSSQGCVSVSSLPVMESGVDELTEGLWLQLHTPPSSAEPAFYDDSWSWDDDKAAWRFAGKLFAESTANVLLDKRPVHDDAFVMVYFRSEKKLNWFHDTPNALSIHIFQLQDPALFNFIVHDRQGFVNLLDGTVTTPAVGSALQNTIVPGSELRLKSELEPDTRYIGIIVGYFDPTHHHSHQIRLIPVPVVETKPTLYSRIKKTLFRQGDAKGPLAERKSFVVGVQLGARTIDNVTAKVVQ